MAVGMKVRLPISRNVVAMLWQGFERWFFGLKHFKPCPSQDPMLFLAWIIAVLVTISVHEFSHALVATALGDPTPERQGRLTLDPRAHIDPFGLIMLVVIGFGWGKPVEFNPYNIRQRFGGALVALAGPTSNVVSALVAGAALIMLVRVFGFSTDALLIQFFSLLVTLNAMLAVFNLIPIPPLDGSKLWLEIFSAPHHATLRHWIERHGQMLLFVLILLDILTPYSVFSGLFAHVRDITDRLLNFFL